MKLGIIGSGNVGNAIALAAVTRGSARAVVLVNRTRKVAEAVAAGLRYGLPLGPKVDVSDGDYDALQGAGVVLITSGVNEKTGGAAARSAQSGLLAFFLGAKRRSNPERRRRTGLPRFARNDAFVFLQRLGTPFVIEGRACRETRA